MALVDSVYERLTKEEDARVCTDISEEACRETPGNFLLILLSQLLTKLGDALANPKTTLAWVSNTVGAPAWVLSFLVPIRESGSLIPQLFIGGIIRRMAVRKWVWIAGSIAQAAAVAGLGLVVYLFEGVQAGVLILLLLVVFSLARGFSSVASKDVVGKTIPKRRRGRLSGWSASAAGMITIGAGLALMLPVSQGEDGSIYPWLLVLAAGLWLLAAAVYARVQEYEGETGGARNALDALKRLNLLRRDRPFRRFVITRSLLLCSALSAPFYVTLAQQGLGSPAWLLGLFVIADGLAGLVSAPLWGRFADRSSKRVMVAAALVTSGIGLVVFAADHLGPDLVGQAWFLPAAYFMLSVAHNGVRVGRQTYVIDLATGNRRTDYVAISNSVIGLMLLLVGGLGALAPLISVSGVIALLALMGLGGAALGGSLPEVEAGQ